MPLPMSSNFKYCLSIFLFICFSFFLIGFIVNSENITTGTGLDGISRDWTRPVVFNAGVVVDVNSKMVAMANICMIMSLSDFYAKHPDYRTRLSLKIWQDGVPETSSVKVVENSSRSSSPYLIRADLADFSRLAKATVATLESFEWNDFILIYEDSEYGNPIEFYLADALENKGMQLWQKRAILPTSAEDFRILQELEMVKAMPSKVLVVHMTTKLASRLFVVASKAGMMDKEFAWLVTDNLSSFVDTLDGVALDSINGGSVVGVRPYLPKTKALNNFKTRYKRVSMMKKNHVHESSELNLFGLLVYDAIWALAMTVERIGTVNSSFLKETKSETSEDETESARRIVEEILKTSFRGISGDLDLVNGQLQSSTFEIFNLTKEGAIRKFGYWTPEQGISRNLEYSARTKYSTCSNKLKNTIKPGDTRRILQANPSVSMIGKKWKIGVPDKTGFTEFVNIQPGNKKGNDDELPGFSVEIFKQVWKALDFPPPTDYEFVLLEYDGTYDDLCCQVKQREIDAAIGDISIVASRTKCVDFTLPYMETGVSMLIKVSHDGPKDMWIFLKPLSWDLWLTIISICIFIGIVVRILDRRENTEIINGSTRQQLGTILMLPCLSVAIPQRDMVVTNCSRLVLVIWMFLAFILMQSYTANLSSILTVNQLQPTIPTLKELRQGYVGYQSGSFVKDFLINNLGFTPSRLKPYDSIDDYQEALSKGSDNDGVSAVFEEIPYIKLFLAQYNNGYMMVGSIYKTDGLGFAFPIGSPLVANFSRAILNFIQGKYMTALEKKYFGKITINQDDSAQVSSSSPSLTSKSFAGLFIIIGVVVLLALLVSENHILGRFLRQYIFCNSHDISRCSSRVQPTSEMNVTSNNILPEINNFQETHSSNQSDSAESTEESILEVTHNSH